VAIEAQAYRNVVVAYDGTDGARAALARAAAVADTEGASLTLVHATMGRAEALMPEPVPRPSRHPDPESTAEARHLLEQAIDGLDPVLSASPWIVGGPAAKGVLAVAEEIHADLIVTGSRAHGRVARALVGSVSTELVQNAPCDVLVVHPPPE
jgi:nucleotide-binding universal stress UspA family protein